MPKLKIVAGDNLGHEYELGKEKIVLGRRNSNTIYIDHPKASRAHAEITCKGESYYVEDLGSANGTYVNNMQISEKTKLEPGDDVRVGGTVLRLFSDEDDLPKISIPGYSIQELVAQGGMGTVFRAVQQSMDRFVALKVLHETYARRPDFVERFVREAQSAGKLNHPNIIGVHDVGKAAGTYYFSMELVSGNDLSQVMGYRTVEYPELMNIAAKIADALDYAHRNGIVHRDIKPENIMLSDDGEVKLADLGIAKSFETEDDVDEEGRRKVFGTPHYMSPEQASGKELDGRSDLYSLGATIYHILADKPPFEAESNQKIMLKHLTEEPVPLTKLNPTLPKIVIDVVGKLMSKKVEDRYATAAEAREALEQAAKGKSRPLPANLAAAAKATKAKSGGTRTGIATNARPRRAGGGKAGKNPMIQIGIFVVVLVLAIVALNILSREKKDIQQGPTAQGLLTQAENMESQGDYQDALGIYRRVVEDFFTDKGAAALAQTRITAIESLLEQNRMASEAKAAWAKFESWRAENPEALAEQETRLVELARYPSLEKQVELAREDLRRAHEEAELRKQEGIFAEARDAVAKIPQTREFDTAAQLLNDYRRTYPDSDRKEDVEQLLAKVREQAEAAYGKVNEAAHKLLAENQFASALEQYRTFNRTVESSRENDKASRAIDDINDAIDKHLKESELAVKQALLNLDTNRVREIVMTDLKSLTGTPQADIVNKRKDAMRKVVEFITAFRKRVDEKGLNNTGIKVARHVKPDEGIVIRGATDKGFEVPLGANINTVVSYGKFSPEEMLLLFRHYTPTTDFDAQDAIGIYVAIFGIKG